MGIEVFGDDAADNVMPGYFAMHVQGFYWLDADSYLRGLLGMLALNGWMAIDLGKFGERKECEMVF